LSNWEVSLRMKQRVIPFSTPLKMCRSQFNLRERVKIKRKKKKNRKTKHVIEIEDLDPADESQRELMRFFDLLREPDEDLVEVREKNDELRDLYIELESAAMTKDKKRVNKEIDGVSDQVSSVLDQIRGKLEDLGKELSEKNTQVERIKRNAHRIVSQKFFDSLQEFYGIKSYGKQKAVDILEHQFKRVVGNSDVTREEIERQIESGEIKSMFTQELFSEEYQEAAESALTYVEDKHKELLKIRDMVMEVTELIKDMHALVFEQGEMADKILTHVNNVSINIEKGNENLREAIKEKKKCHIM